jgi:hypothetical protein
MGRRLAWMLAALCALGPAALTEEARPAPVTLRGEVVDLHCFLTRGAKGPEHAGCANACIARGVSAGFLADDGQLYVLLAEKPFTVKDAVAGLAGGPAIVEGTVAERTGVKAIRVTAARRP